MVTQPQLCPSAVVFETLRTMVPLKIFARTARILIISLLTMSYY
jgi:hypothetical protein